MVGLIVILFLYTHCIVVIANVIANLIGKYVHQAVEESRITGSMVSSLNSTFLALILKVDRLASFGDFRSISLCNIAYKVISKLIGLRLTSLLSKALSLEQFGFLKGRKILDVVGVAQECIHNIKSKKLKALKMDL